jgi:pyruvate/2-oxoglutarate dehydrogenase complex dihydrolipoamide acyltransferase (E2) component
VVVAWGDVVTVGAVVAGVVVGVEAALALEADADAPEVVIADVPLVATVPAVPVATVDPVPAAEWTVGEATATPRPTAATVAVTPMATVARRMRTKASSRAWMRSWRMRRRGWGAMASPFVDGHRIESDRCDLMEPVHRFEQGVSFGPPERLL